MRLDSQFCFKPARSTHGCCDFWPSLGWRSQCPHCALRTRSASSTAYWPGGVLLARAPRRAEPVRRSSAEGARGASGASALEKEQKVVTAYSRTCCPTPADAQHAGFNCCPTPSLLSWTTGANRSASAGRVINVVTIDLKTKMPNLDRSRCRRSWATSAVLGQHRGPNAS
jgi:hypothetical protein